MKVDQDQKAEYNLIWEVEESFPNLIISRFILNKNGRFYARDVNVVSNVKAVSRQL